MKTIDKYGIIRIPDARVLHVNQIRGLEIPVIRHDGVTYNVGHFRYINGTGVFVTKFRGWDRRRDSMMVAAIKNGEILWSTELFGTGTMWDTDLTGKRCIREIPPTIEQIDDAIARARSALTE